MIIHNTSTVNFTLGKDTQQIFTRNLIKLLRNYLRYKYLKGEWRMVVFKRKIHVSPITNPV